MSKIESSAVVSNAIHIGQLVVAHVLAGGVGYSIRYLQEKLTRRTERRHIEMLFGLTAKHVSIVHSAVFDEERQLLNFPSSDMQAVRVIAHLLEKTGRTEGKDFEIVPVTEFERVRGAIDTGPDVDVIAICGPKRNAIVAAILKTEPRFRFSMRVENGKNVLTDRETNAVIAGSEDFDHQAKVWRGPGTDFGVVQSIRNPFNRERRVTIIAGLRGSGTAGAALALAEPSNLAEICKRGGIDTYEVLTKTIWVERPEQIVKAALV